MDHFSKYGLSDSDEEDNGVIDLKRQKLAPQATLQSTTVPQFPLKQVSIKWLQILLKMDKKLLLLLL